MWMIEKLFTRSTEFTVRYTVFYTYFTVKYVP